MIDHEAIAKLRRLMEARLKRDETKQAATDAEKEYREVESEVYEALSEGPVDRLNNIDLGDPWGKVSFHAKETHYGKIIDDEAALQHYEGRQMVDEVSAPKFVMARISEEVRDCIEQDQPLPPGVSYTSKRYIQITRQKA